MSATDTELETLRQTWRYAWRNIGAHGEGEAEFQALIARYSESHRHYHTPQHLAECFAQFEASREAIVQPAELAMALFFHDAIHDIPSRNNEELSAVLADDRLSAHGAQPAAIDRVKALILATRHQRIPVEGDERIIVDIDLSILGAPPARYQDYEHQVRKEYAHVPDALFWQRRGQFLLAFLARPSIYSTPYFQSMLENAARDNLCRSLKAIGDSALGHSSPD